MDAMDGVERLAKKRMLIAFLCVVMDVFCRNTDEALTSPFQLDPSGHANSSRTGVSRIDFYARDSSLLHRT